MACPIYIALLSPEENIRVTENLPGKFDHLRINNVYNLAPS